MRLISVNTVRNTRTLKRCLVAAVGIATLLLNTSCSVLGKSSVEEASYRVLSSEGDYELREYAPLVVAETLVDAEFGKAGNIAFKRLFGYISGDNIAEQKIAMTAPVIADANEGEKIAMTAPVIGEPDGSRWRYRFVLPASYSMETAPTPRDETVAVVAVPGKTVAVLRFSGWVNQADVDKQSDSLAQWMAANDLQAVSGPRWAGYNPPWTLPFFRRNEVMIDVGQ